MKEKVQLIVMMKTLLEGRFQEINYLVIQATDPISAKKYRELTEMTESTLGHQLPLSPHLSIKARSHTAIVAGASLIAVPITTVATIATITAVL